MTVANANKGDEAYTENPIGPFDGLRVNSGDTHIPEAVSIVKSIKAVGNVVNVMEANTEESQW